MKSLPPPFVDSEITDETFDDPPLEKYDAALAVAATIAAVAIVSMIAGWLAGKGPL